MSRFESLENLTRVGLDVDPGTRKAVERGRVMRDLLRQPRFCVRSAFEQIFALTAVGEGWLDGLPAERARALVWSTDGRLRAEFPELAAAVDAQAELPADWKEQLGAFARERIGAGS
jgi:F-type H+-transporting ATPase subunit alpha